MARVHLMHTSPNDAKQARIKLAFGLNGVLRHPEGQRGGRGVTGFSPELIYLPDAVNIINIFQKKRVRTETRLHFPSSPDRVEEPRVILMLQQLNK